MNSFPDLTKDNVCSSQELDVNEHVLGKHAVQKSRKQVKRLQTKQASKKVVQLPKDFFLNELNNNEDSGNVIVKKEKEKEKNVINLVNSLESESTVDLLLPEPEHTNENFTTIESESTNPTIPIHNIGFQQTYQCVAGIGFAKPRTSNGIVLKCLKGCVFTQQFKSLTSMKIVMNRHFNESHADAMHWSGFCSSCSSSTVSRAKTNKKKKIKEEVLTPRALTMSDEIEHIIFKHISYGN